MRLHPSAHHHLQLMTSQRTSSNVPHVQRGIEQALMIQNPLSCRKTWRVFRFPYYKVVASALTLNQSLLRVFFRAFSPNIIISCSFGHSALPKTSKFSKEINKTHFFHGNFLWAISHAGVSQLTKTSQPRLRRSHRSNSATALEDEAEAEKSRVSWESKGTRDSNGKWTI